MKKSILAVVVALILSAFAVQPARAIEPMGAAVLTLIVIGPHVARDLNLPSPPPVCKTEKVKAENGNYYFTVVSKDNPSNCQL